MEIVSAEFKRGIIEGETNWDPTLPQIVFYGRSNVGKSSTINALLERKSLAKSSSTPGKTREANFFLINDSFYCIDLPGYGYTKAGKEAQKKLHSLISWFVGTNAEQRIHIVILDAKVGLTDLDRILLKTLFENNQEVIIVLNKIDKLNQSESYKILRDTKQEVGEHITVIPFSAVKKRGVLMFWNRLEL